MAVQMTVDTSWLADAKAAEAAEATALAGATGVMASATAAVPADEAAEAQAAEAGARAAAVVQARARGERDRRAVQARQREGSLPGQERQRQESLQQESDAKVAVVRAEVQQLKEALQLPLAGEPVRA